MEYDKTSIPLMETNPPLHALVQRAGRQFVRVYPTYPDISTSRGPWVARVANHPPTFFASLTHLLFPAFSPAFRSSLFCDFSLIFLCPRLFLYLRLFNPCLNLFSPSRVFSFALSFAFSLLLSLSLSASYNFSCVF